MAQHSLDDLVRAVRGAAIDSQRRLVLGDIARLSRLREALSFSEASPSEPSPEGVVSDAVLQSLVPAPQTRITRLGIEIPVTLTEVPGPDGAPVLALVPGRRVKGGLGHRLSIELAGADLAAGSVSFDGVILHTFENPQDGGDPHP